MLIGRERELRTVATLLDDARRGRSGMLVLVGEPGLGKTALLEAARRSAADMRVVACTGVESESELPFASLHELLRPVLPFLPAIPELQARSLAAALALGDGEPDTLAVAAGTLSLLVEAAESVPVLVLVDDAHWLDRASLDAIVFAARRLHAEPVAVLMSARPDAASPLGGLARLDLEPLQAADAKALLATRADTVAPADEGPILAAAAGNPLALLELPAELARDLPATTTAHERLSRAFASRLAALPADGRLAALLLAAEPDPPAVRRAATSLRLNQALEEVESNGILTQKDGALGFRHPVVRSLLYADATPAERITAHRALADALPGEGDRDRRAWHLAASVDGADEAVAALLETTAERAIARGGHAAGARALERAARLSPERADCARRLYAASRSEFWGGSASRAQDLAEEALPLADDPLLHSDLLQQVAAIGEWQGTRMPETALLQELERVVGLDDERPARLLYQVVKQRLDVLDAEGAVALARRLEEYARGAGPWWMPRTLAGAAAAYLYIGERERATELFLELTRHHAIPAGFAFDYMSLEWWDELRSSLAETLREGRTEGNLLRIVWNQCCLAHLELRQGRLSAAEVAAAEAIPLGEALGVPALVGIASAALAGVRAWRGDADGCTRSARLAVSTARETGDRYHEGLALQPLAQLALAQGRPEEAITLLEPLARTWVASTTVEPSVAPFVPDLIEAYGAAGQIDAATALLTRFAELAAASPGAWARGVSARCEGILVPEEAKSEDRFAAATTLLEQTPFVLELARARLASGERLRRRGRRRDARPALRAAYESFAAAGATLWEERSRSELRATGESVSGASTALPNLTPQELLIASLVAEGKSNKEIAAAIYLSPKTVEYHLGNMFRKLDIHSRAELARIMAGRV